MKISNNYIVGFIDACFYNNFVYNIIQIQNAKNTFVQKNVCIHYKFIVHLPEKSANVLYAFKKKFKCGKVIQKKNNVYTYIVCKKNTIQKYIIPFFMAYVLQTANRNVFLQFVKKFYEYEKISYVSENIHKYNENSYIHINNEWFTGFVDNLGDFSIQTIPFLKKNVYFKDCIVCMQMKLCVNAENKNVLYSIQNFVGCGNILNIENNKYVFIVKNVKNLIEKIFPKLYTKSSKSLLKTIKRIKFQKFRKIVLLYNNNEINTEKNIKKIQKYIQYIHTH